MTRLRDPIYAGHRYPAEIISYAIWLYFRFPLSLRMVKEMLAARGISVTHETIRRWGLKFGREFANRIRQRAPRRGDKWHLDEVVISFAGKKHWLWRAVDQHGFAKDITIFGEVPAQSIDALCALAYEKISGPEYDAVRLLRLVLDGHKAHGRPLCRLADRLGISRVILLPLHERLDVGRWDQPHCVAQLADLPPPIVRPCASFHRDNAGRLCRQKPKQLRSGETLAEQRMAGGIRPVRLEDVLRDVQPDRDSLFHGRLLQ